MPRLKAERFVGISAMVLIGLGFFELLMGSLTGSIGLVADGIDSMGDSLVSLFVWFGLRLSRRAPDNRFNFGYYRIETLFSFLLSIVMFGMGLSIAYTGYMRLLNPHPIALPLLAIASLLVAGSISLFMALYKRRMANTLRIMSLKVDASNSIKDSSASFIVLASVILASLGFHYMDAVGAIIIAVYLFNIAATTIRESSLVLVDAFNNPALVSDIRGVVKTFRGVELKATRLRSMGSMIVGEITITVDGNTRLNDAQKLKDAIRSTVMAKIAGIHDLTITAEPMRGMRERIMVFLQGTSIMHANGAGRSRGDIVRQVLQDDESVHDYDSYISIGSAPEKLRRWERQRAEILYVSSHRNAEDVKKDYIVLKRNGFPEGEVFFRREGEDYKDIVKKVMPDILIEDDCESIGGFGRMIYPHIRPELKLKVKSIVVREFGGIDHLPDDVSDLMKF